jgi:hypothetical protein
MINNSVYRVSPPTLKDNEETTPLTDSQGNLKVNLASSGNVLQVGLATSSNILPVEERFTYLNITTSTGTLVKSGAGMLHNIVLNSAVASGTVKLYDATVATGTALFATITPIAAPVTMQYDVVLNTGLFVQTNSALDITVSSR